MLLEFAGFQVNYAQLFRTLGTSDLGTPHSRIQRLTNIYPYLSVVYRKGNLTDVISYLESGYPVALFVNTVDLPYWSETAGHAVVVTGYAEQHFYLNDPMLQHGSQIVSQGDLDLAWEAFDYYLAVVQSK
jgi:ABC-type bacteriocin/lantibiotic exporter with double-glycine peptidase domain